MHKYQAKSIKEFNALKTREKAKVAEKNMKLSALRDYLKRYCRGKEYISFIENLKRFLLIFTPYFLVILVAAITFSVLMQVLYLSKL